MRPDKVVKGTEQAVLSIEKGSLCNHTKSHKKGLRITGLVLKTQLKMGVSAILTTVLTSTFKCQYLHYPSPVF